MPHFLSGIKVYTKKATFNILPTKYLLSTYHVTDIRIMFKKINKTLSAGLHTSSERQKDNPVAVMMRLG